MTEGADLATQAAVWSAIGQCASAVFALGGLGFIGWQIKEAKKTADLQALQTFMKDARDHEQALLKDSTPEQKEQAFVEFLNFLETSAAAVNGGLFPKVSREIVSTKLRDSIVVISEATEWHEKFANAVTSHDTFKHLAEFMKKRRIEIRTVAQAREAHARSAALAAG